MTLDPFWKQFTLKCRVDVSSPNGMDWKAEINGMKIGLCLSVDPKVIHCRPGYSVERPDNTTMNLIVQAVYFQNTSVAGNYCCYPDDGIGDPACSNVIVTGQ